MVGRSKRPLGQQLAARELSRSAVDAHHFDRLGALERGQDRGKAPGEHRLAGPRRPAEKAVVGSGRRNDECLDCLGLAANVAQIGTASRCARLRMTLLWQSVAGATAQYTRGTREALDDAHGKSLNECRLACALRAQNEHCQPGLLGRLGNGKGSMAGTHLTVERKLAKERVCIEQLTWDLPARREYPARQCQVESGSDLWHIGGGEVRGDPPRRELKARVQQRSVNAVARLAHGGVGEPDDRKRR